MRIHGLTVRGAIDQETRCIHYHSDLDRVAIKFYCCERYFPCIQCHAEYGCGEKAVWPRDKFNEKAILCGNCGEALTINNYLNGKDQCPMCMANFNPGCSLRSEERRVGKEVVFWV